MLLHYAFLLQCNHPEPLNPTPRSELSAIHDLGLDCFGRDHLSYLAIYEGIVRSNDLSLHMYNMNRVLSQSHLHERIFLARAYAV